ncbi:MAG: OmpA/MotB family protein [Planctomycetota bacterium]|jgi:chemotaxis protein MotB
MLMRWGLALTLSIALVVVSGCETEQVRKLKEENDRLNAINMEHIKETRSLLEQLELLKKEKQLGRQDLDGLNRQIEYLKNKLANRPRGDVLTGAQRQKLLQIANAIGGELIGNRILLPGDFLFSSGSWIIKSGAKGMLKEMSAVLAPENFGLMVVGHTDNEPIKKLKKKGIKSNRHLSLIRALAVVDYLEKYCKYPSKLVYPAGWGELQPVASNSSKSGKAKNRRVEIYIDPDLSNLIVSSAIIDVAPVDSVRPVEAAPMRMEETVVEEAVPVINSRGARWEK